MPGTGRRRSNRHQTFIPRLCGSAGARLDFLCCHAHLRTNSSHDELTVEMEDGSLSYRR